MKKIVLVLLVLITLLFAGCSQLDLSQVSDDDLARISDKAVVCNEPYMRIGLECCLDQNQNNICDIDEGGIGEETEIKIIEGNISTENQNSNIYTKEELSGEITLERLETNSIYVKNNFEQNVDVKIILSEKGEVVCQDNNIYTLRNGINGVDFGCSFQEGKAYDVVVQFNNYYFTSTLIVRAKEVKETNEVQIQEELSKGNFDCKESDNGKDYYTKGFMCSNVGVNSPESGWDSCLDENLQGNGIFNVDGSVVEPSKGVYLSEVFCNDNNMYETEIVLCPYGCYDGACEGNQITCKDSDNGINEFKKGYLYSSSDSNLPKIYDSCVENVFGNGDSSVKETYCNSENMFATKYVRCLNGCSNGACIKDDNSYDLELSVERLEGDYIYVKSNTNVEIDIEILNTQCNKITNYAIIEGVNEIPLSNCNIKEGSTYDVELVTGDEVFRETHISREDSSNLENENLELSVERLEGDYIYIKSNLNSKININIPNSNCYDITNYAIIEGVNEIPLSNCNIKEGSTYDVELVTGDEVFRETHISREDSSNLEFFSQEVTIERLETENLYLKNIGLKEFLNVNIIINNDCQINNITLNANTVSEIHFTNCNITTNNAYEVLASNYENEIVSVNTIAK